MAVARIEGGVVRLPAFASAHSHAFQRAMRGRAERPGPAATDDFWSWREAMYDVARALDPDALHAIARVAYRELRAAGVAIVGEFHYVHHQPDGTPYADRLATSEALVRAALDEGVAIALLRVVYARKAKGQPAEGVQRRFVDADLDAALGDVDALAARYAGEPRVRVGVAPHSVRAVPPEWLGEIARFADARGLPLHAHVAEQPAEVAASLAETGRRPVELLAESGVLGPRFVAVHATHLAPHEARLLGQSRATVCLCPTTERDLGDGLPDVGVLRDAGVALCTGVDSHVASDPFEDMRGIELGERLRTGRRCTDRASASPAGTLWDSASAVGARALGFADVGATLEIDRDAPGLALVDDEHLLDAIVFSGTPRLVRRVVG